jgi:hypothetical protein
VADTKFSQKRLAGHGETFGLEEIAQAYTDQTKTLLRSERNVFPQRERNRRALRFALNASPCGLRRAALRVKPTGSSTKTTRKDITRTGGISNEVRMGTFLKSFDNIRSIRSHSVHSGPFGPFEAGPSLRPTSSV